MLCLFHSHNCAKHVQTCCQTRWSIDVFHFTLYHTILTFNDLKNKPFEIIAGEGENAGNQHFLLFPQCFLPIPRRIPVFKLNLICCLQMLSMWTSLKFCSLVQKYMTRFFFSLSCKIFRTAGGIVEHSSPGLHA